MITVMNTTKWQELRIAMHELTSNRPKWRTKCVTNGYISEWDGEWYYHFSEGGFKEIEWVEIKVENEEQKRMVLKELKSIHLPGHEVDVGYKVYGYVQSGQLVDYI